MALNKLHLPSIFRLFDLVLSMGFIISSIIVAISFALVLIFGQELWVFLTIGVLVILGSIPAIKGGHRAFRTGVNTDVTAYAFGIAVGLAIAVSFFKNS